MESSPLESTSLTSSIGGPNRSAKRNRWRQFRSPFAAVVVLGLALWCRGLWWPIPFQTAAREALLKHEDDAALQWLNWATYLAPEDGETAFLRARTYRRIGSFNQAFAAIKRAKLLAPSERLQREEWLYRARSGQLNKVSRHVPELMRDPRGESEEINEALILGCILTQHYVEANEILQTWIKDAPTHARPYILRAKFWQLKSQFANALEDIKQAIALEPENFEAVIELATIRQRQNEFEEAIPLFERVLNVPRFGARAHVGLAVCLQPQGVTGRIRRLLERAVTLAPEDRQAQCELGRLDLETGHYAAAVTRLNEAVRIAPRDDECHYVLAQALVADGRPEQAQSHFEFAEKIRDGFRELSRCEELLTKNPQNVEAMVCAGSILLDIADQDEGVPRLLAALEIEPNHTVARKRLADHFARRAETNPEFRKFVELYRDPPQEK